MKKTLLETLIGKIDNADKVIRSGKVKVNGEEVFIPSTKVKEDDDIVITKTKEYVSRGAYKLIGAIEQFNIDFKNKIVLDIGSSAGGFTQVSLEKGAKKVYSLDSGTNQLDYKLRSDERVVSLEKTNLKTITKNMFEEKIDIVVCDVSFISLRNVFDVLTDFQPIEVMALIKPQFEAFRDQVEEGGFVKKELHKEIIDKIIKYAKEKGFDLIGINESPIKGNKSKNIEYITFLKRS